MDENPNIKLKIDEKFQFYSPDEQGWRVSVDEKIKLVVEESIESAMKNAFDDYNQILEDNLRELLTDSDDTRLSLTAPSYLRLALGDGSFCNTLLINLAPAVAEELEAMDDLSDNLDLLKEFEPTVEFWEQSAKRLREKFEEIKADFGEKTE